MPLNYSQDRDATVATIAKRRTARNSDFSLGVANLQQKLANGDMGALQDLESRQRSFGVSDAADEQALADANLSWFNKVQADPTGRYYADGTLVNPPSKVANDPFTVMAPSSSATGQPRNFGMSYNDQAEMRAEQARQRAIAAMADRPISAAAVSPMTAPRGTAVAAPAAQPQPLPYTVDGRQAFAAPDGSDPRAGKFQRYLNGKVDYYSAAPATLAQNPAAVPAPDGGNAARLATVDRESKLGREYRMRQQSAMARQQFPLPRIQTRVFEPPPTDQADQ